MDWMEIIIGGVAAAVTLYVVIRLGLAWLFRKERYKG